jgi:hypothetical protein
MRLYVDNSLELDIKEVDDAVQNLSLSTPYIGLPERRHADVPLYLNIERSALAPEPENLFQGRIGGRSIGTAGIKDTMITLVASREGRESCPGHQESVKVVNIAASRWIERKNYKPVGQWGNVHSLVSVRDDFSWALFLAGQSFHFDGRVVGDCVACAAQGILPGSVLIWY